MEDDKVLRLVREIKAVVEGKPFRVATSSERVMAIQTARVMRLDGTVRHGVRTEKNGEGYLVFYAPPNETLANKGGNPA